MKTVEVDYYSQRDSDGLRSYVRTVRLTVPIDTDDVKLPFLLTEKIGKHEGIRRVKVMPQ